MAGFTSKPIGHWTRQNMRAFMESFARKRDLDPLLADTWYKIPYRLVIKSKVCHPLSKSSILANLIRRAQESSC